MHSTEKDGADCKVLDRELPSGQDQEHGVCTVLALATEAADGATLASALARLAAKMRRLAYPAPPAT